LPAPEDAIIVAKPEALTMTVPFTVYKKGNAYFTTYDVAVLKNAAGVTYYVSPTGNDTNDGLTEGAPLKVIKTAYSKGDVADIVLLNGFYTKLANINTSGAQTGLGVSKAINISAENKGKAILLGGDPATWTKTDGQTNVYQATVASITNLHAILDTTYLDSNEQLTKMALVASVALCDSTAGSYYAVDTTVYIHTFDSRATNLDTQIILMDKTYRPIYVASSTTDFNCYLEGIDIYGGQSALSLAASKVGHNLNLIGKNCRFIYSASNYNVFYSQGGNCYFQNCIAAGSTDTDGFNYHKSPVTDETGTVIEINCVGRNNGTDGTDNGSTIHDGYQIVRINGVYYGNAGPNLAETNAGTVSWNIGCVMQGSTSNEAAKAYDSAEMHMEGCVALDGTFVEDGGTITELHTRTDVVEVSSTVYKYQ
jgi:hypothetical protein